MIRGSCNHHDPSEGTETACTDIMPDRSVVAATITTRQRVLKLRRVGGAQQNVSSCNHHDPSEGTETHGYYVAALAVFGAATITTRQRVLKPAAKTVETAKS